MWRKFNTFGRSRFVNCKEGEYGCSRSSQNSLIIKMSTRDCGRFVWLQHIEPKLGKHKMPNRQIQSKHVYSRLRHKLQLI